MPSSDKEASFFPRGAIASFVVMLAFYGALWFAMYWLMAARG
ncbi:MAG TPA: hypothetical protein VL403_11925 [Candidatus Kryptonia bacterium]|nr:hypothetical protein [Candidatus Kryptonia bacterium]